jgi:hypothetical protein
MNGTLSMESSKIMEHEEKMPSHLNYQNSYLNYANESSILDASLTSFYFRESADMDQDKIRKMSRFSIKDGPAVRQKLLNLQSKINELSDSSSISSSYNNYVEEIPRMKSSNLLDYPEEKDIHSNDLNGKSSLANHISLLSLKESIIRSRKISIIDEEQKNTKQLLKKLSIKFPIQVYEDAHWPIRISGLHTFINKKYVINADPLMKIRLIMLALR